MRGEGRQGAITKVCTHPYQAVATGQCDPRQWRWTLCARPVTGDLQLTTSTNTALCPAINFQFKEQSPGRKLLIDTSVRTKWICRSKLQINNSWSPDTQTPTVSCLVTARSRPSATLLRVSLPATVCICCPDKNHQRKLKIDMNIHIN